METRILKGAPVRKIWTNKLKEEVQKREGISLHVIIVGNDPASISYMKSKEKRAEKIGVTFYKHELDENVTEETLIKLVNELNEREDVTGIMIEFPLPKHINAEKIISILSPLKDVDALTAINQGKIFRGDMSVVPSTPRAALELALYYGYKPSEMNVAVIGRSSVVGMPLIRMLLSKEEYGNATVTVCHSRTANLAEALKDKNLIFVAAGVPKLLRKEYIKEGTVIIDIGVNECNGGLCGDSDYENLLGYVSAITPVPGGVGPLTATFIYDNLIKLYDRQNR